MRLLVFSDIHGNLPALENVLRNEHDVEGYINLGDVVNYGPWSNECVELINSLDNCHNILGNHEEYFNSGICDVESELVQNFFKQTFSDFSKKKIISKYQEDFQLNKFKFIHTLGKKNYIFRDTQVNLKEHTFIGHSHQQYLRLINNKILINPGSIGQNRKHINVSNYVLWNTSTNEFELKFLTYNVDQFIAEMKRRKYPKNCIEYYKNKKRY